MSESGSDRSDGLERAYQETSFEMVEQGNMELPVAEAARFRLSQRIDAAEFQAGIERGDYAFIAPYEDNGYLSSKILVAETNEFLHVKLRGDILNIFPKSEEFSKETLQQFVEDVHKHVADLELEVQDDE